MSEILIVGAGAIGRVYGHCLAAGGARVSVLVRPRHVDELRGGVSVRRVPMIGARRDARFVPADVLTDVRELATRRFDQVWLGLPTNALDEPWVDALIDAVGDATLVSLQPGAHVRERLGRARHLVSGAIGVVAWASPLDGSRDRREVGAHDATAYWLPPLQATMFSSDEHARADEVARALRAGGCPARVVRDASLELAKSSAIILPLVAALEASGWSLRALRRGPGLSRALAGSRALLALATGSRPPWIASPLRAPLLAPLVAIVPAIAPFDLERYLEVHFSKVGTQTRVLLAEAEDDARSRGIDPAPIHALRASLDHRLATGDASRSSPR
ncbi:ketopantoate reductase family protein [Sandaracinus amylolyticus]|uniref:Ketopantoate reductase N-terminal domain-containing protein n=1 Tax=Sandaracinus amylolyticus TaxID=927083 RepID=A0A0F6W188_9BACT|nr:2-dehydropantoate 2-reductase N-terminal domain-containing protein [Sandaracinus amylolyticus]AKF04708.1 hypothetical protein DB32_001857 [Sandaracinus amylolyticus]